MEISQSSVYVAAQRLLAVGNERFLTRSPAAAHAKIYTT
jgi:hypothetical protein